MTMPFDAMTEISDEALLVAYGNGDRAAAQALTLRLTPRIFGYAARVLSDRTEAEDVVQEAMLRLWKIAPDWRQGEAQVSTWLYRVTVNLCTDRLRKSGRSVDIDAVAEPEDGQPSAVATMIDTDRAKALQAALDTLPERQRQAVVLRHLEGLSNPEIAVVMDIGVEAVESLTARGKRALRAALSGRREELGYDDDGT
ncbi:MAG: RNA polymerase sigma factor [Pseudomonadota bacterium]